MFKPMVTVGHAHVEPCRLLQATLLLFTIHANVLQI